MSETDLGRASTAAAYPAPIDLVPHGGRMMLLERVLHHDENETECAIDVATSTLFAEADGSVPAWVAVEYMAQTIAAHGGLVDRAAGRATRPGVLVSSRNLNITVDSFADDQHLRVHVRRLRGKVGMAVFDCRVMDAADPGPVLVSAKINVYLFESYEAMLAGYANGV